MADLQEVIFKDCSPTSVQKTLMGTELSPASLPPPSTSLPNVSFFFLSKKWDFFFVHFILVLNCTIILFKIGVLVGNHYSENFEVFYTHKDAESPLLWYEQIPQRNPEDMIR